LISHTAGGDTISIRRRGKPKLSTRQYVGGFNWKLKSSTNLGSPGDRIIDYLKYLLENGKPCYSGVLNFKRNKSIQDKYKGWNTLFGEFHIDDKLK